MQVRNKPEQEVEVWAYVIAFLPANNRRKLRWWYDKILIVKSIHESMILSVSECCHKYLKQKESIENSNIPSDKTNKWSNLIGL